MKLILAGTYPEYTYEKLSALLDHEKFELQAVDTLEAYERMTDAEILILRIFKADETVIKRNPKLKMIMRWGAGFDSVDIKAAGERGILVTNTPGANAAAVAELAVMLMLAVGRKLLCHQKAMREGIWSKNTFLNESYCLNHKMVGIIGGGNIGRQVALRVQVFGASTQYYDAVRLPAEMEQKFAMKYVPFQQLLETSDLVTLHIPLTEQTRHILGKDELSKMRTGAILINTARGGLVDDEALADAVEHKKLAGAGLDGVEQEPLKPENRLLNTPDIIVTPHIGGGTADIGEEILPMLYEDMSRFVNDETVMHVVNRQYLAEA